MTLSPLRCEQTGMHYLLLDIMRALFDHNSAQLVLSQKRSRSFSLRAGLLQGSFLSPLLYSIFLDPLVDSLKHRLMVMLPSQSVLVMVSLACFFFGLFVDGTFLAHRAAVSNVLRYFVNNPVPVCSQP
jgi:hypothetical protein